MEENTVAQAMPLIGDKAPVFKAITTKGKINFPADFKGNWVILFSHPADFTPVCTTEFMTFASMQDEFRALSTELIGLSVDSLASHISWLRKINEFEWNDKKHVEVQFPLIVDISMEVSKLYGMIHPNQSGTSAVRAVFIIDPEGIIRTVLYYPMSVGRNFDEIKRIVQALQKTDEANCATPADWRPGDDVVVPIPSTLEGANELVNNPPSDGTYSLDWFLSFKPDK